MDTQYGTIKATTSVGKYEGCHGIVEYIDVHGAYDENGGDVESPVGWVGLAGRWVITHDERGAVYGYKCMSRKSAREVYEACIAEYDAWCDAADEAEYEMVR